MSLKLVIYIFFAQMSAAVSIVLWAKVNMNSSHLVFYKVFSLW